MKTLCRILIYTVSFFSVHSIGQTLTSSNATNEGGALQLINPLKTANNIANNWTLYNMTGQYGNSLQFWNYGNGGFYGSRFTILDNGNVGIGTSTPSNIQGWDNVLDVSGTNNSKILATTKNSLYKNGIFSHPSWHGGGGFIGTESNHSLFLIAGYDPKMTILANGNIGIGTKNPTSKLTVAGNINSREVKVSVNAGADFVFDKNYALPSLQEVEKFITENKHLPEIASAKEMQKEGINLSEMNIKLLQKIEELTLYLIQQQTEIEELKKSKQSLQSLAERVLQMEKKLK